MLPAKNPGKRSKAQSPHNTPLKKQPRSSPQKLQHAGAIVECDACGVAALPDCTNFEHENENGRIVISSNTCHDCNNFCEGRGMSQGELIKVMNKPKPSHDDAVVRDERQEYQTNLENIQKREFVPQPVFKEISVITLSEELDAAKFTERSDFKKQRGSFPDDLGLQQLRKEIAPNGCLKPNGVLCKPPELASSSSRCDGATAQSSSGCDGASPDAGMLDPLFAITLFLLLLTMNHVHELAMHKRFHSYHVHCANLSLFQRSWQYNGIHQAMKDCQNCMCHPVCSCDPTYSSWFLTRSQLTITCFKLTQIPSHHPISLKRDVAQHIVFVVFASALSCAAKQRAHAEQYSRCHVVNCSLTTNLVAIDHDDLAFASLFLL